MASYLDSSRKARRGRRRAGGGEERGGAGGVGQAVLTASPLGARVHETKEAGGVEELGLLSDGGEQAGRAASLELSSSIFCSLCPLLFCLPSSCSYSQNNSPAQFPPVPVPNFMGKCTFF